jgi:excisionase family DNA binding protein
MEQLYSYSSAAKILDISVKTLRRLIVKKQIPLVFVGERARIEESSLIKLVVPVKDLDQYNINL